MLLRPYSFLIFLFNSPLTYKLQIFPSHFDNVSPTPPPSHAKASRRWSSFHVSTTCRQHHLPRTQKRAGGGFIFTFQPHFTTATSLARKSEPEVVFFSRFALISPLPTTPPLPATSSPTPTTPAHQTPPKVPHYRLLGSPHTAMLSMPPRIDNVEDSGVTGQ